VINFITGFRSEQRAQMELEREKLQKELVEKIIKM
jgi:hypothetical protein